MPAQKRSSYDDEGGGKRRASPQREDDDVVTVSENGGESDRSPASSNGEEKRGDHKDYVTVNLSEIRKEVQCPICLGIIRRTRTMMECLHRFCRECIDKSMRLGNNECPACRTHCASRRSLRDDPNYDALIAALYPDIDKFEEEEFAFDEEENSRNKQIQASIGNTILRQAKGVKKRRRKATEFTKGKKKAALSTEIQGSDGNEDEDGKEIEEPSSADEHNAEARPKRIKRSGGTRSSSAHSDEDESDPGGNKEAIGPSCGLVVPSGNLTWGKNGVRSHTRHGNTNGTRNTRVSKLVDYLKNSEEHDDELNLQIVLVSFDEASIPNLQRPYLCCKPSLSVKHLLQYVALHTASQADQLELYLAKDSNSKVESSVSATTLFSAPGSIDPLKLKLQALEEHDTLSKFPSNNFLRGHLLLVYQKKQVEMEEVTVYKSSA